MEEKNQTIANLAESIGQKEILVREMEKSIAEKSTAMFALSREVAEKNEIIESMTAELRDLKEILARKDERSCTQVHEHILELAKTVKEIEDRKTDRIRDDFVRKNGKLEDFEKTVKNISAELRELSAYIAKTDRQTEDMRREIDELKIRLSCRDAEYFANRKLNNAKKLRELQSLSTASAEIEELINKLRCAATADCNYDERGGCRTCEAVHSRTPAASEPLSDASSGEMPSLSKYTNEEFTLSIEMKLSCDAVSILSRILFSFSLS
jgi:chromosome segregation ATPase